MTYTIGKGNNLGQNQFLHKDEDLSHFEYQGTIQNIFDDADILAEALQANNHIAIISKNPEFLKWEKTDEAENATRSEYLRKMFGFLDSETQNKVKLYIKQKQEKFKQTLSKIEEIFKTAQKGEKPEPIYFDDDMADFEVRKLLLHTVPFPTEMDSMISRHKLGLLASEWFGKLEHRREDRFCCSFTKSRGLQPKENAEGKQLTFIVDAGCKDMKQLMRLDIFQYCRNKAKNELDKYTEQEKQLLESLLEWSSNAKYVAQKEQTWVAIPAGIPSKYIVGIIASGVETAEEQEMALQIGKLFNVPMLKPDLTLLSKENQINV